MTVHMASFGYELLAALEELLDAFDESEGDGERVATITPEYHAEVEAVIARARGASAPPFQPAN
jgi:hypothetical protein